MNTEFLGVIQFGTLIIQFVVKHTHKICVLVQKLSLECMYVYGFTSILLFFCQETCCKYCILFKCNRTIKYFLDSICSRLNQSTCYKFNIQKYIELSVLVQTFQYCLFIHFCTVRSLQIIRQLYLFGLISDAILILFFFTCSLWIEPCSKAH